MSLEHILLGILSDKPLTGYDISKWYQMLLKYFYPTDQRTIYRALKRMHENGWVDVEVVVQDSSPNRKVYHLTQIGKSELKEWLSTPLPLDPAYNIWLGQLFFGDKVDTAYIVTNLQARRQQVMAQLEELERRANQENPEVELTRQRLIRSMTLAYGVAVNRFRIEWFNSAIQYLEQLDTITREELRDFVRSGFFHPK
jgi:PadR family transcriptional regulator, regulatory protein AphA